MPFNILVTFVLRNICIQCTILKILYYIFINISENINWLKLKFYNKIPVYFDIQDY